MSETVTPGMTPCGSRTVPRRPPWNDCATRSEVASTHTTAIATTTLIDRMWVSKKCGSETAGAQPFRVHCNSNLSTTEDTEDTETTKDFLRVLSVLRGGEPFCNALSLQAQ